MVKTSRPVGPKTSLTITSILAMCLYITSTITLRNAFAEQPADDNLPVLDMRTTAEFLDPEERISGGAAVGVIFYDATDSLRLDAAYVYFAEPVETALEMHLATVDGRYLATFDYEPVSPISGWVRLNLSLSKPEFLRNYDLNEIALLMTNADTGVAYPVRWGEQSRTDIVRVYINTEGAKSYFVTFDTEKNRHVSKSCTPASRRSSFKFDRICDIPVMDVIKNEIEIVRKRGAGFGTPISIPVSLPANEMP